MKLWKGICAAGRQACRQAGRQREGRRICHKSSTAAAAVEAVCTYRATAWWLGGCRCCRLAGHHQRWTQLTYLPLGRGKMHGGLRNLWIAAIVCASWGMAQSVLCERLYAKSTSTLDRAACAAAAHEDIMGSGGSACARAGRGAQGVSVHTRGSNAARGARQQHAARRNAHRLVAGSLSRT